MAVEIGVQYRIQARPPFAFDLALRYLRSSPSTIVETITADSYVRPLRLNGRLALVQVRAAGDADASVLDVSVVGDRLGAAEQGAVEALVRRTFATDVDVSGLDESAAADPVFGAVARACRGLRPILIPDLFETLVWAIIGQQINVQFAAKCKRALVERFGDRVAIDGRDYLLFPSADTLAAVAEAELAAIQFSRQKIRYVLSLSREIASGRLDLDDLWALPADLALEKLQTLLGVGRWTAEYVLLRGLGDPDVIPAADGGLRRIIGQAYGLGRSATEAEVRARAEAWAGWRSYAAFYWWFTLQQQAQAKAP